MTISNRSYFEKNNRATKKIEQKKPTVDTCHEGILKKIHQNFFSFNPDSEKPPPVHTYVRYFSVILFRVYFKAE